MIKILGVTGTFQAGKDTVASLIGWKKYSCSDVIREECKLRGLSSEVNQNLVDVGDDLRKSSGDAGFLAKNVLDSIRADAVERAMVVSIRTPAEVFVLKNAQGVDFRLLVMDAPLERRFERAQHDSRFKTMVLSEFKAQEDKQMHGGEAHNMHLAKVFEQADARIWNDFKSKEELKLRISEWLKKWWAV